MLEAGVDGPVEARAKTLESFREKVTREGKSYNDPLNEITDLCGVRVIVRTLEDVDRVSSLISQEMTINRADSATKGDEFDPDRFGYRSVHLNR